MLGKFSFVLRNGLIDYFYSPFNNGVITNVIRRFARPTGTSRARILSHTPRCVRRNLRSSKQTFYEYSVSVLMASCILIRAADTSGDGFKRASNKSSLRNFRTYGLVPRRLCVFLELWTARRTNDGFGR